MSVTAPETPQSETPISTFDRIISNPAQTPDQRRSYLSDFGQLHQMKGTQIPEVAHFFGTLVKERGFAQQYGKLRLELFDQLEGKRAQGEDISTEVQLARLLAFDSIPEVKDYLDHLFDEPAQSPEVPQVAPRSPQRTARRFGRRVFLGAMFAGGVAAGAAGGLAIANEVNQKGKQMIEPQKRTPLAIPNSAQPPQMRTQTAVASHLQAATPTAEPTREPTHTPEPTPTPEKPLSLVNEFLKPFIDYAMQKRFERRSKNPAEYDRVVDRELNENRINFVLMGYGEEHGETYQQMGGSIMVVSIDLITGKVGNISVSRDVRAPELEQRIPADKRTPQVVRHAYAQGGFDLLRKVTEDATGLAADFQVVIKDTVIRDLIRDVTGPVTVEVPKEHDTQGFRLDGHDYPPKVIHQGVQEMDAMEAMYYMLSEDKDPGGKEDVRSYRTEAVTRAIIKATQTNIKRNPMQLKTIKDFVEQKLQDKDIVLDFDAKLMDSSLKGLLNLATKALTSYLPGATGVDLTLPQMDSKETAVIHDPFWGDGSVSRVHNIRNEQSQRDAATEVVRQEADAKKMPDYLLVPDGGDPYTKDLPGHYWQAVRNLVKTKLRQ